MDALINKRNAAGTLGRYQYAMECYDRAIEIEPNHTTNAFGNKGWLLHFLGKLNEDIEYYDKALKIELTNSKVLTNKSKALEELKKRGLN